MGPAERRLEMLKYISGKRYTTLGELAEYFNVSVRTVQRDIYEIEIIFRVPLEVKRGRHGGITVLGDYTPARVYMQKEESELLEKLASLAKDILSPSENTMLKGIIQKYKHPKN